jgi:hypothetical protein
MRVYLLALTLALSTSAWATKTPTPSPDPSPDAVANSEAVGVGIAAAGALSTAESSAAANQGQEQSASALSDQSQSQSLSTEADQANSQSTSINHTYNQVRQTPSAFAGGTNTTAQCHYSVGFGGSAPVAGLSLGFGRKDKDCERLVLAQYLRGIGQLSASQRVLCQITELKRALGEDCIALVNEIRVEKPTAEYATKTDLDRAFRKAMEK